MSSTAPGSAAGVRAPAPAGELDSYYRLSRPEVRALVPTTARRVLDVGCGAGALGAALRQERGAEVWGVELFPDAAATAAEHLDRVVLADLDALEALPPDAGRFDAMVFADVLEHLRDPHRLLRALRPSLSPDGVLVASIPNVKHWTVLHPLLVRDEWSYVDAGLLDRTHVHLFTLEEISRMLSACGFTPVGVTVVDYPMPPELAPLLDAAVRLGGDRHETAARLSAYQYLVTARPVADPIEGARP